MERVLMEWMMNAAWQLPVLAAGGWLLVRVARPGAAAQYRIWMGVLALAVAVPLAGVLADAGPVRGAGGLQRDLVAARVEVVPGQAAVVKAKDAAGLGSESMAGGAGDFGQLGQPSGPALGMLGGGHGAVAAVWSLRGLAGRLERIRRIEIGATAEGWIAGVYLVVMLLGLMRIVRAWSGARRLVCDSDAEVLAGDERALMEECARRMSMTAPEVRTVRGADVLAGPVVVGAGRPVLLCPSKFVRGLMDAGREDEAMAAVCHEMAHIRRRDYAMNLVCEALAAPLKWHPVTHGVERRIRGTREMACDAMAARVMESDAEYARCLIGLAERMVAGGAMEQAGAVGLFHGNVLEERVMRLMNGETAMTVRAKVVRGVAGAAAMMAAVTLAGMFHVVTAKAQVVTPTEAAPSAGVVAPPALAAEPKVVAPVIAVPQLESAPAVAGAPRTGVVAPAMEPVKPGQTTDVRVLAPVHTVVKLSKIAPVATVAVSDVQPKVHVVTSVHDSVKVSKIAPMVAVAVVPPVQAAPAPEPKTAPTPEPQAAPAPEPQAAPAPAPQAAPAPAPQAAPVPAPQSDVHHHEAIVSQDGKMYAWVNGQRRELTPAERARVERQLEAAQKKIAAETARMSSPEFKAQMEKSVQDAMEAERKLRSGEIQRQIAETQRRLNSPEFRKQMADAQRNAMAAVQREMSSPEFKAKMTEAQKRADEAMAKMQSPEFKRQMAEAQQTASRNIDVQMAQARKQLAEATAKMNSPEFREQIEKAQRDAMEAQRKVMNGEIQKQMADAQKQLKQQLDELKAQDGK
jgi:beta-lactamase regulating signal transducer with metallopeptidase domain